MFEHKNLIEAVKYAIKMEIFYTISMYVLRSERVFGPYASGPKSFWSGRVQTKTSGTNPSNLIFSLSAAFGPRCLAHKRPGRRATNSFLNLK